MKLDLQKLLSDLNDASPDDAVPSPSLDIPCFQCGVCCVKWQPLLSPQQVRQLASDLGMAAQPFSRRYTRAYPLRRGWRQLKATETGCVFLGFKDDRAFCTIYPVRPAVCRSWGASLSKGECQEGLRQLQPLSDLLPLESLYPDTADRERFTKVLQSAADVVERHSNTNS